MKIIDISLHFDGHLYELNTWYSMSIYELCNTTIFDKRNFENDCFQINQLNFIKNDDD